eukprot:scaffold39066_cov35-Prasinocladus_malaysianus.AAC.1
MDYLALAIMLYKGTLPKLSKALIILLRQSIDWKVEALMILATTNSPWDLDEALRRRLEKRIFIPLPDRDSRASMFRIHLKGVQCDECCRFEELADMTAGFSGADIKVGGQIL